MFCPNCGRELREIDRFCPSCGIETKTVRSRQRSPGPPWKWIAIFGIAAIAVVLILVILSYGDFDRQSVADEPSPARARAAFTENPVATAYEFAALPVYTPVPMAEYEWLEVQQTLQSKSANFVPLRWSYSGFRVGATSYNHGVGITMKGSSYESVVDPPSDGVWSEPYSEVFLDIPAGQKFIKMTFDIGFDNTDTSRWGDPSVNGYGRLVLLNAGTDQILYDSGVVDYTFNDEFISVDTSDVDVLRIVYQVSPVTEKQRNSLNLVLGKAMLYKYGDRYTADMAYSPMLDSLPTSYAQYENSATDYIERFILRGYREKYSQEELLQFSQEEMEYVLNGVYALSGKWFGKSDLWDYFTSKPWYYPVRADITDNEKNSFQQANENTIVSYMKSVGWR